MSRQINHLYEAGTFLNFYHGEFDRELLAVEIPGMSGASWDRRAAWLLWLARGNPPDPVDVDSSLVAKPRGRQAQTIDLPATSVRRLPAAELPSSQFDDILG